jgi:NAD(P)H dehydrogenase (quinone)
MASKQACDSQPEAIEARLASVAADFAAALPAHRDRPLIPFNRMEEWGEDGRIVPTAKVHSPFVRRRHNLDMG